MEEICKKLLARTYEMPLPNCQLRQCGANDPIIYEGPGLVTQNEHGRLRLLVFAASVEESEKFDRTFKRPLDPGQLVPETEYYDFQCIDQFEVRWTAKRLSIDPNFGAGTYIQAEPLNFEKTESLSEISRKAKVTAFVPGKIDLPWHNKTTLGNSSVVVDRFEFEEDSFRWVVRKVENGIWLVFESSEDPIEQYFSDFIRALSILTGQLLQPIVYEIIEHQKRITRLCNTSLELDQAKLLPPIPLRRPNAQDAHTFLKYFIKHLHGETVESSQGKLIHRYWHRILRARENDIENSSLVLSVAIEGLIKEVFASKDDLDSDFVKQLEHAKPILKNSGLQERALSCVLSSIGNAMRPRTQDVLQRLIREQLIEEKHLTAWKKMRHAAAHGEAITDEASAFQSHIDRFHICLDIFYRLVFKLIGYAGQHNDFSSFGWPVSTFPANNIKQASEGSARTTPQE